jgi:DedD protein
MNDGFKQRLVGAVVLVSLGLILWPLIFSDAGGPAVDRRSQIPPRPDFEKFTVKEPVRPAGLKPVPTAQVSSEYAITAKLLSKEEGRKLDKQGLPISWTLQVGSFVQPKKANELKASLQKSGYKAYTHTYQSPEGQSTRVFIGPKFQRDTLLKIKTKVDKVHSVNSMVVRYVP